MIKKENNKKKLQAFTSCRLLIIVQEKWLKTITIQFPNSILIFLYTSLCYMLYVYVICVFGRSWRYDSSCFAFYFISLSLWLLRLFETLQSLFWSVFGLLNLYVTNVKARHEFTEFVGATMFGTYNVISLVVLLNMLIAMMNNSYQLIAVSAIRYWRLFL